MRFTFQIRLLGGVVLLTCGALKALATEWLVKTSGGNFTNIQAALDSSLVVDGDVITVDGGTWTGDFGANGRNWELDFNGKALTLRSAGGPSVCTIDCADGLTKHRAFWFHSAEGPRSIVMGFTISHAKGHEQDCAGLAILCQGTSPKIVNCVLSENSSDVPGALGGAFCCES
jgi:hypothetical protein